MSIVAHQISKTLDNTNIIVDVNVEIQNGEFVAITGRSGSGKSSLLYLLSSLDIPTHGDVIIDDHNLKVVDKKFLYRFRNEKLGFVFQFHYLLSELSALENVLLPAKKAGKLEERRTHAKSLLERFELGHRLHHLPREMSGGEQQRVAIARALVMEPSYLFADEPTGSLDSYNSEIVMNIIREFNVISKTTILLVTHEESFAKQALRQIKLSDGKIVN